MSKGLLVAAAISVMLVACQACVGNISQVRESMEIDSVERMVENTVGIDIDFVAVRKLDDHIAVFEGGRKGTGVVLGHVGTETMVLTAAHVCEVPRSVKKGDLELFTVSRTYKVHNSNGSKSLTGAPIRQDMTNDLCVMKVSGKIGRPVEFAGLPRRFSKVVVPGGPIGLFGDGVAYVGEGRYIGSHENHGKERYFVSVPTAGGGSGSGVFHRGKLVGVIIAVSPKFNHGTVFVPISTVKRFLGTK